MDKISHLNTDGKAIFEDRHTKKAKELLTGWSEGAKGEFGLVGLPLSKPSISHSCASLAPGAIRSSLQSYSTYSNEEGFDLTAPILDFGDLNKIGRASCRERV